MARILIVTGEASGDLHGANLAKALRAKDPQVSLAGIGGAAMEAAGVQLVCRMGQFDVMGMVGPLVLVAIVRRFFFMRRLFRSEPWDVVIFVDNPGLNLRYAYFAKSAGLRVLYYVAPQIWAWGHGGFTGLRRESIRCSSYYRLRNRSMTKRVCGARSSATLS